MIQRAYKTKLVVNNREANTLRGCAGLARFVYNWGLAESKREYEETGKTPSARYVLSKQFNAIKREQFPWVYDYPYDVMESAFNDLENAYKHFFRRVKAGETPGYPRFKRRGDGDSFRVRSNITVEDGRIKLPRIGRLRLAERGYLPAGADVNSATVSCAAGAWYISVQVEEPAPEPVETTGAVLGVDLGVLALAAVSDGTIYPNPAVYRKNEKKLARLQRELSRRKRGGENWKKTKAKIAKLQRAISNTRRHHQHNTSADLTRTKRPAAIVLEDLNVKGMAARAKPRPNEDGTGYARNGAAAKSGLSKSLADAGMGELRRQIIYKAGWAGIHVETSDRWFASSKTCSGCGAAKSDLTLADRVYRCPACGLVVDRDVNAARNLAALLEPVMHGGLPAELGGLPPTMTQEAGSLRV